MVTSEILHGEGNEGTNGKLRCAKEENRICCYSKHMLLVKGWILGHLLDKCVRNYLGRDNPAMQQMNELELLFKLHATFLFLF